MEPRPTQFARQSLCRSVRIIAQRARGLHASPRKARCSRPRAQTSACRTLRRSGSIRKGKAMRT
eukprot:15443655-Alexandrium_andersonii.AAC.1